MDQPKVKDSATIQTNQPPLTHQPQQAGKMSTTTTAIVLGIIFAVLVFLPVGQPAVEEPQPTTTRGVANTIATTSTALLDIEKKLLTEESINISIILPQLDRIHRELMIVSLQLENISNQLDEAYSLLSKSKQKK